jgi:glycine/D-amino acid oxidase-like deaminating enzyme
LRRDYDYIIVGQGLAGTCLAHALRRQRQHVLVIDDNTQHSASMVAGGLYNPITGRNMVLTWMAKELFDYLPIFYTQIEQELGIKLLNEKSIFRPFTSNEELNEWQGKASDAIYKPYVSEVVTDPNQNPIVNNPFGGLEIKQTGYLNTKSLLSGYGKLLLEDQSYLNEKFDGAQLNLEGENVVYKERSAGKVIFCEGPAVASNPWFDQIKIIPLKGEVLTVKTSSPVEKIYNKGIFVIPIESKENTCLVGSTYLRNDLSWSPTEEGRNEIEERLKQVLNCNFQVIGQRAGVRPTVVDRRPVMGLHPKNEKIAIFNGLGTKGVSLAPYFAEHFASHLTQNRILLSTVNVTRFFT